MTNLSKPTADKGLELLYGMCGEGVGLTANTARPAKSV